MLSLSRFYDTHMHTSFSGDSEEAPENQIRAAKERGLGGLIFTDHMDLDFPEDPELFHLDLENYLPYMRDLSLKESTDTFKINVGMELGLREDLVSEHQALLSNYDFDYIIGSIHLVDKKDPYYDSFYEGKSVLEAYESYFTTLLENINLFSDFDALGHLDYIVRYAKRHYGAEAGALSYSDFPKLFDEIFHFLIQNKKALEINTGAFRTGLIEPNPSYELIERYFDLGGRMITIGADAHQTAHVGLQFEEVLPKLKEIGFEGTLVYKDRNPQMIKL